MWNQTAENEWVHVRESGDKSYLIRDEDLLLELVVSENHSTIHEYIDDGLPNDAIPLLSAEWQSTTERQDLANLDSAAAWNFLHDAIQP